MPWPMLRERLQQMLADGTPAPLEALPELPPGAPFDQATLQRLSAVCVRTPVYGTRLLRWWPSRPREWLSIGSRMGPRITPSFVT